MGDRSGQKLDKYRLIRLLGSGSFGEVYLAEQIHRKTQVAVKILPQLGNDDLIGFLNEARTVVLRHPHIVQILDFGIDSLIPFIVMEYIPNGTLRQLYPKGTRVPLGVLITYVKQIADALDYAHDEKLIHRDVKPENILIRSNNEVLLSDFGIATMARSSRSQSVLEMAGTVAYMAPEQILGKPVVASDQYALGVVVYECLSGERPFSGGPIELATQHMVTPPPALCSKVPTLSSDIEQVVLTTLEKDPLKRFASVRAFANALEQAAKPPKRSDPVVPNFISPVSPISPLLSSPKEQTINATPSSPQQSSVLLPNTILPTPEKPLLIPSQRPAFLETSLPSKPVVKAELASVEGKKTTNFAKSTALSDKIKLSRLLYTALTLVILSLVGLVGGGTYFYLHLGLGVNVDQNVRDAQHLIAKANNESNPATALQELAIAQATLRALAQNSSLSATQHSQVMTVLQNELTSGVQTAITSYNNQSAITTLCSANSSANILTVAASQPKTIALVQGKSGPLLYALGMDGVVYLVNGTSLLPVRLPSNLSLPQSQILGMAGNGSSLVLLGAQPSKPNDPTSPLAYTLNLLPTDQVQSGPGPNQLPRGFSVPIGAKLLQNGQTPELIATSGADVYVVFGSEATQTSVTIVDYLAEPRKPLAPTIASTFSFSHSIMSMTAFPNHQLFFLLADGTLSSIPLTTGNQAATSVLVQNAIPQPLTISAQAFTWQTPVPAVPTGGTTSLLIPRVTSTSALAVGLVNAVPHLFILDTGLLDTRLHRVLELAPVEGFVATPTAGVTPASTSVGGGPVTTGVPVTLKLVRQFASSPFLTQGKSIAVDLQEATVDVLTQNAPSQPSLVTFGTNPQNGCV